MKIERGRDGLSVSTSTTAEVQPFLRGDDPTAVRERREQVVVTQIVRLFDELSSEMRPKVVGTLSDRLTSHSSRRS